MLKNLRQKKGTNDTDWLGFSSWTSRCSTKLTYTWKYNAMISLSGLGLVLSLLFLLEEQIRKYIGRGNGLALCIYLKICKVLWRKQEMSEDSNFVMANSTSAAASKSLSWKFTICLSRSENLITETQANGVSEKTGWENIMVCSPTS